MIRHLCKLLWNRKRANLLIMVEIFLSFLILFSVLVIVNQAWQNFRHPLGFDFRDRWIVRIDTGTPMFATTQDESMAAKQLVLKKLISAIQAYPQVAGVAGAYVIPYDGSSMYFLPNTNGVPVTDSFKEVMGLTLVDGRWFQADDDQVDWQPIILNQHCAKARYGDKSALGQRIQQTRLEKEMRVVGVVSEFRKSGEYDAPENILFRRVSLDKAEDLVPQNLVVKIVPGTTAVFEETLLQSLRGIAPHWSYTIESLEGMREVYLRTSATPWMVFAMVVGFLLLMVGLGLNGVLWQSVTRRTKEIGLRRAHGAAAVHIYVQILGELLLVASVSMLAAILMVIQLPLRDILGFISPAAYTSSIVLATLIIYLLAALSALYPAWLAARIHPAQALHWE